MSKFRDGSRRKKGWSADDAYARAVELYRKGVPYLAIAIRIGRRVTTVEKYIQHAKGRRRKHEWWTNKEIATLIAMRKAGEKYKTIATKLDRTKNSCIGESLRLQNAGVFTDPIKRRSRRAHKSNHPTRSNLHDPRHSKRAR